MFERLLERSPGASRQHLEALAAVWVKELDAILRRMLEICVAEKKVMPLAARHEVAFELAKLTLWLQDRIIEKKTATAQVHELDPISEEANLARREVQERIENTARMCAERIWAPLIDDWHRRFPLVRAASSKSPSRPQRLWRPHASRRPAGKYQHFSPVFSNEFWATGSRREARVYSRGLDDRVESRDVGYTKWGRETYLYSPELEEHLSLMEGDGAGPYQKLLDVVPLGEPDVRKWVAFLIAQLFRTPAAILRSLSEMPALIASTGAEYSTDVGALRRVHEDLFTNDEVLAKCYPIIAGREWTIATSAPSMSFIRGDVPVVVRRDSTELRLLYPMTPRHCFIAGPNAAESPRRIVPAMRELSPAEVAAVNRVLAASARSTVMAIVATDDSALRGLLQDALGAKWARWPFASSLISPYWGGIR